MAPHPHHHVQADWDPEASVWVATSYDVPGLDYRREHMPQDEIIEEVRAIREAYAERFGFDVLALYRDAKSGEGEGGRPVVDLKPKPAAPVRREVESP